MNKNYVNFWLLLAMLLCLTGLLCACGGSKVPMEIAPVSTDVPAATAAPTPEPPIRVTVLGKTLPVYTETLTVSGRTVTQEDIAEISAAVPRFLSLKRVCFSNCELGYPEYLALREACPELEVQWSFVLHGVAIRADDTLWDFTGVTVDSTEDIERMALASPFVEKIDMTDTGLTDEQLEDMNTRLDNVHVVWTLHIGLYDISTDATGFRAYSSITGMWTKENLSRLKYCHDMIALDFGHRDIRNLDFLYGMPHLRYLLLLSCNPKDITPIGSLQELVFLELNGCWIEDLSPVLQCSSLEDLNIVSIWGSPSKDNVVDVLKSLNRVQRVWLDKKLIAPKDVEELQQRYPNIIYHVVDSFYQSTEDPWRYNQNYYDMRDELGMFYMNGNGTYITYKIIDGVRYDLDEEFIRHQMETTIGDQ